MIGPGERDNWAAILPDGEQERARQTVSDIADCLAARVGAAQLRDPHSLPARAHLPYVGSGLAGHALFWTVAAQCQEVTGLDWSHSDAHERADMHLERAMEYVAHHRLLPSFLGGAFGIAWTLELLHRAHSDSFADYLADDLNEDADAAIAAILDADRFSPGFLAGLRRGNKVAPMAWEYDAFNGLAGVAIYGLDRLPRARAAALLRGICARLHKESESSARGITWYRPADIVPDDSLYLFPDGHYSLGLGHGNAGVVAAVAQICARGAGGQEEEELLRGAVKWLLSWHRAGPYPRFPGFLDRQQRPIPLTGITPYGGLTPLCWTNTDLGIALALTSAGLALDEPPWVATGLDIAVTAGRAALNHEHCSVRMSLKSGAPGVAHILNRLWQATGDPRCRDLALRTLRVVLDARTPGAGLAGYFSEQLERSRLDPRPYLALLSLTEGIAGIALTLLAALTPDVPPTWDNMLLLSLPVAQQPP